MDEKLDTLIVDDEVKIRRFLYDMLTKMGHKVTEAESGEAALDLLQISGFDLAILDLKLGGRVDGQRVLEAIRWRWPSTLIIMLTAHGTLESAVEAIREGVDGYLLKPVRPADIRQAIEEAQDRRKILQKSEHQEGDQFLIQGPFKIDLKRHEATLHGKSLDLSPRDYALLCYLIENAPKVVSPKELVQVVRDYKTDFAPEAREIIKWYIHRLRKKVETDPSRPRYILNVRGVGYRFDG
jgi:DNA-binding response OmpR family regulator